MSVRPPGVNGNVGSTEATPPAQTAFGQALPGRATSAQAAGPGEYSLDFADTDIREVASQILGQLLRVSYTIDPTVRGTATFHSAEPLPRERLLPTLQVLLGQTRGGTGAGGVAVSRRADRRGGHHRHPGHRRHRRQPGDPAALRFGGCAGEAAAAPS